MRIPVLFDRRLLIDASVSVVLAVVACTTLASTFDGAQYLWFCVMAATAAAVLVITLRRWPAAVTLFGLLALLLVVGSTLGPTSGFRIPSITGSLDSWRSLTAGWKELLTAATPVVDPELIRIPVALAIFGAGGALLLANRTTRPILPVLPVLGAFVVARLLASDTTSEQVTIVAAGAVITVGWGLLRRPRTPTESASVRPSSSASASAEVPTSFRQPAGRTSRTVVSGVMAVVVVGATGTGAVLGGDSVPLLVDRERATWRGSVVPTVASALPSPLVHYRLYIKDYREEVLFEVSGLEKGGELRLATLDHYDGSTWTIGGGADGPRALQRIGAGPELDLPRGRMVDAEVWISDSSPYRDVWLPTPGPLVAPHIDWIDRQGTDASAVLTDIRHDAVSGTVVALDRLGAGDRYAVRTGVMTSFEDADDDLLVAATDVDSDIELPEQIRSLAAGLPPSGVSLGDVRRLAEEFRKGRYSDSAEGDVAIAAGHGISRLAQFATSDPLVGNAEQYSAAFAAVLRDRHLDARVVLGFRLPPGEEGAPTSNSAAMEMWAVRGADVDAWVEVSVADAGWVAVFPTPNRSRRASPSVVSEEIAVQERSSNATPNPRPLTAPGAVVEQTEQVGGAGDTGFDPDSETPVVDDASESGGATGRVVVLALLLAALCCAVVAIIPAAKWLRRRRRRRVGDTVERAAQVWNEVLDVAADVGREVPEAATRSESARVVAVPGALSLARRIDDVVFRPDPSDDDEIDDLWADALAICCDLRRDLTTSDRVAATLALASFKRR